VTDGLFVAKIGPFMRIQQKSTIAHVDAPLPAPEQGAPTTEVDAAALSLVQGGGGAPGLVTPRSNVHDSGGLGTDNIPTAADGRRSTSLMKEIRDIDRQIDAKQAEIGTLWKKIGKLDTNINFLKLLIIELTRDKENLLNRLACAEAMHRAVFETLQRVEEERARWQDGNPHAHAWQRTEADPAYVPLPAGTASQLGGEDWGTEVAGIAKARDALAVSDPYLMEYSPLTAGADGRSGLRREDPEARAQSTTGVLEQYIPKGDANTDPAKMRAALDDAATRLRGLLAEVKCEIADIQRQIKHIDAQVEKIEARIEQYEHEKERLRERIEQLEREVQELLAERAELERKLDETREEERQLQERMLEGQVVDPDERGAEERAGRMQDERRLDSRPTYSIGDLMKGQGRV
jgi:peptidoglycan hydrolase CwlO-like protein